jgi:hypothetical protein
MESTSELRRVRRRRLQSWHPEIFTTLLGEPVSESKTHLIYEEGWICRRSDGVYFNHRTKDHGSTLHLVQRLRGGSLKAAADWLQRWEHTHPGWGSAGEIVDDHDNGRGDADDDDPDVARRAAKAREIDAKKLDGPGPVGSLWLARRGLEGTYDPAQVWHMPASVLRPGDVAVLFPLYARGGQQVGFEVNYLDVVTGQRSLATPQRYAAFTVRNFAGPVTFIPFDPPAGFKAPGDGVVQLCEGWCDMKSLELAHSERLTIGTPGVAVWANLRFPRATSIMICRDGDAPKSDADKGVFLAADQFLNANCRVSITAPDLGKDNNDYYVERGLDGLRDLLEASQPRTEMSLIGTVKKLVADTTLNPGERDQERWKIKKAHEGVSIGSIREMERLERDKLEAERERIERDAEASKPAWDGPISGDKAFNDTHDVLKRWVVLEEPLLRLAILAGIANPHLHHNQKIIFGTATNLKIEAAEEDSGKTTLLQLLGRFRRSPPNRSPTTRRPRCDGCSKTPNSSASRSRCRSSMSCTI